MIQAAADLEQFVEDLNLANESPRFPTEEEEKPYNAIQKYGKEPLFIDLLREEARQLVRAPPAQVFSQSPASTAAQKLNVFFEARWENGQSLRKPSSAIKEERPLFDAVYRYQYHPDFINSLSDLSQMVLRLKPETEEVAARRARAGRRKDGAQRAAQDFAAFLAPLRNSQQTLRLPPTTGDNYERNLRQRIMQFRNDPLFRAGLPPDALELLP